MSDNGKAPKLRPGSVKIHDQESHCWRVYKAVMPAACTMQDLQDFPELFAGQGFREDDELYVVAHDRSWCVTTRVITVAPDRVQISKPSVNWSGLDGREGICFDDGQYEGEWLGGYYGYFRKGQGDRPRTLVKEGFTSLEAMKKAIAAEHPRRV
jgi:hypothetical protein